MQFVKKIYRYFIFVFRETKLLFKKFCDYFIIIFYPIKQGSTKGKIDIGTIHPNKAKIDDTYINPLIDSSLDLSIIIPFYNAEKYIKQCIDSILSQKTTIRFQIILVNDGSTDNSEKIVNVYLSNDNFLYLKQNNQGQSVARNNAINHCNSKFIMFVDADDILLPDAIETLFSIQKKTDAQIVEGGIIRFNDSLLIKNDIKKEKIKICSYKVNSKFILSSFGYSCGKIYDRTLWNNVRFPVNVIFEDIISKYILKCLANEVVYTNKDIYGYRCGHISSSHSNTNRTLDSFWVLEKVLKMREDNHLKTDQYIYLMILAHVGELNNLIIYNYDLPYKLDALQKGKDMLLKYKEYRYKNMPILFKKLEKSILMCDLSAWNKISLLIRKNGFLKGWREIN